MASRDNETNESEGKCASFVNGLSITAPLEDPFRPPPTWNLSTTTSGWRDEADTSPEDEAMNPFDDGKNMIESSSAPRKDMGVQKKSLRKAESKRPAISMIESLTYPGSSSRELLLAPGVISEQYLPVKGEQSNPNDESNIVRPALHGTPTPSTLHGRDMEEPGFKTPQKSIKGSLKDGYERVSHLLTNREVVVRWTIPFDRTNKAEILKISGTKGIYRCTLPQIRTPEGMKTIFKCLLENLPQSIGDAKPVPFALKFHLIQPIDIDCTAKDAARCFEIMHESMVHNSIALLRYFVEAELLYKSRQDDGQLDAARLALEKLEAIGDAVYEAHNGELSSRRRAYRVDGILRIVSEF